MLRRVACSLTVLLTGIAFAAHLAGPAAAGGQLTKKAFQKRANDVCGPANLAIADVFNDTFEGVAPGDDLPPDLIAAAAHGAVPILRLALDRIEDLDGPGAFERAVDKMVDQYRVVADAIEHDPGLILSENDLFEKPDKAARRLGLRRCVQEPS